MTPNTPCCVSRLACFHAAVPRSLANSLALLASQLAKLRAPTGAEAVAVLDWALPSLLRTRWGGRSRQRAKTVPFSEPNTRLSFLMKAEAFLRRSASKLERTRRKAIVEEEGERNKTAQLCSSGAARPVDAPPPRRPGHVNKSGAAAQLVAVCATWLAVQLLHKPLLQRRHPASVVCLGVAWPPRPDTCAQRDGCSVEWLASRLRGLRRYWSARASWGWLGQSAVGASPGVALFFFEGFATSAAGAAHVQVQNSPFRNEPGRAEPVWFWIR